RPATQKMLFLSAKIPRGKMLEDEDRLVQRLSPHLTEGEFKEILLEATPEEKRAPDETLEEKLNGINWELEKILIHVGRLIGDKGLPTLMAALPLILEHHPHTRLLVVGHGPLREVMEAWFWALEKGEGELLEKMIQWGSPFEETRSASFDEVRLFFEALRSRGEFASYLEKAKRFLKPDRVLFLGYLEHPLLRFLFPCADAAVFPSVVPEAGPLVFLEALASGCFPVGTYLGGMASTIDTISEALPKREAEGMKISPDPRTKVLELVLKVAEALEVKEEIRKALQEVAEERFDWRKIAKRWSKLLHSLVDSAD